MKKSQILWAISLLFDGLVCFDKFYDLKLWYIDNLIKMYFVYFLLVTLATLIAIICTAYLSRHVEAISDNAKKTLTSTESLNSLYFKISRVVSVCVAIIFGMLGCWWFFALNCIQICCVFIMTRQLKAIRQIYNEKYPESKIPSAEEKLDKKAKFKFLKTI